MPRLLVHTRKGLFSYANSGGKWQLVRKDFLGEPVSIAFADGRDGSVYAALNLGHFGVKMHVSRDDGQTWNELPAPAFDKDEPGRLPRPDGTLETNPPSVAQVWALEGGGADKPNVLWAGTIPGGLFRSDDRGQSWQLVRSLWDHPDRIKWMGGGADAPGIHSICVDPRDSDHVSVGVSCGGVWSTFDGGKSWEVRSRGMWAEYMPPNLRDDPVVQDPHRVVSCRSNPDAMWAQHHNGIFRTTDAGKSWREVPCADPANFGFAVAVHPRDPEMAWFVPAMDDGCRVPVDGKVVVTRTRDGGRTFDVLRAGLPQDNAYDIVFRHALDIHEDGNLLAFGSTTGSLWVTDDAGDTWQTLSTNLPPVYGVRFG